MREQPQSLQERFTATVGWSTLVAQILAMSVHPMLRTTFGARYFDFRAGIAVVVILLFSAFWREHDPYWLYGFAFAFMFTCAMARKRVHERAKRGEHQHSYYSGWPLLCRMWPFRRWRERTVKGIAEPLLVAGIAGLILQMNQPLGVYLLWCAAAMRLTQKLAEGYERTRMLDMRDAYLEQQHAAERFRSNDW